MEHEAFEAFCTYINDLELAPYRWPGDDTQPASNETHIQVTWSGAGSSALSVCGGTSARSRFVASLLVKSVSGTRYGSLTELLDQIRAALPLGLRIGENPGMITVSKPVDVRPPYTDKGWYIVPALIFVDLLT